MPQVQPYSSPFFVFKKKKNQTWGVLAVAQWDWWCLDRCDVDSIPSQAWWVKDLVLLQLWLGSQLWLRYDSWPGNSICCGEIRKEKEKKKNQSWISVVLVLQNECGGALSFSF